MMTKEEYEKTYIRMMDSMRGEMYKGEKNCNGVVCDKCPIQDVCTYNSITINAPVIVEIVERWDKEHPVITNADKYEEVFGRRPQKKDGTYICPQCDYCEAPTCEECKIDYWESEYVEPKKDGGTE